MAKRKKAFKVLDVETKCEPDDEPEEPRQPFYLKYKFELLLVLTLLVSFFIRLILATKINASTDEGIHLYESSLILKGLVPYKDFTYIRQPVAKYILVLFFMIFGQNLFAARLLNAVWISLSPKENKAGGMQGISLTGGSNGMFCNGFKAPKIRGKKVFMKKPVGSSIKSGYSSAFIYSFSRYWYSLCSDTPCPGHCPSLKSKISSTRPGTTVVGAL